MKKLIGAAAFALVVVPAAHADVANNARIGLSAGTYQLDSANFTAFNPDGSVILQFDDSSDREFSYGLLLGYRLTVSGFFGDIGLELLQVSADPELRRTDFQISLGYAFDAGVSLFGGYRIGSQALDDFFDNDIFEEEGPFVGVGGLVPMGDWALVGSLAYAFNQAKFGESEIAPDFDYGGVSARLGVNIAGTPHTILLRYQNYSGDGDELFSDGTRLRFALEESYLQLLYQYNIAF